MNGGARHYVSPFVTVLSFKRPPGLGSEAALRAAYDNHANELFGFARSALGDVGAAEEAVQETFLRGWRAADRYDERKATLRTWLFAILRNVVIDQGRARSVRPPLVLVEPQEVGVSDYELDGSLVTFQLEQALRRLGEDHRVPLVETYYRGRSTAEVAAELGVPEGTVVSRRYYALRQLRLIMEEMGWDDER